MRSYGVTSQKFALLFNVAIIFIVIICRNIDFFLILSLLFLFGHENSTFLDLIQKQVSKQMQTVDNCLKDLGAAIKFNTVLLQPSSSQASFCFNHHDHIFHFMFIISAPQASGSQARSRQCRHLTLLFDHLNHPLHRLHSHPPSRSYPRRFYWVSFFTLRRPAGHLENHPVRPTLTPHFTLYAMPMQMHFSNSLRFVLQENCLKWLLFTAAKCSTYATPSPSAATASTRYRTSPTIGVGIVT